MKQNKVWGETSEIWAGNNCEVHLINAKAGGYCSKHLHQHKFNLFHVEHGELQIEIWKTGGLIDKTVLIDGESTVVPPQVFHRFTALNDTKALEIYWVKIESEDIEREDQGGVKTIEASNQRI